MNVLQRIRHQGALDGVLARRLAALAGAEVLDIAAGRRGEMNLARADGAIEAGVVAAVDREAAGALGEGVHDRPLRNLDQLAALLQRAADGLEHPGRPLVVAPHAALFEHADRRIMDQLAFVFSDGVGGSDQLSSKTLHLVGSFPGYVCSWDVLDTSLTYPFMVEVMMRES